jgi:hypothetical protein
MGFEQHTKAVKIGSQTSGADGNVSIIYLPGRIATYFTGLGIFYPDNRETQRIGIVPDIEIVPTIRGIREGRDEVLEAALNYNITNVKEETPEIVDEFKLHQNYPNPFNPATIIKYSIPSMDNLPSIESSGSVLVQLKIYDILGREVAALVNEEQGPGYYEVEWDASNQASGVYFYRLSVGAFGQTSSFTEIKKMILLR